MGHDAVLTFFIIVAAIAIVLQAVAMLGVYRGVDRIQKEINGTRTELRQQLGPLVQSLNETLSDSRQPLTTAANNLAEVSRMLRERTASVDALADELVSKTRMQIVRVDQAIADILEKFETTTAQIQRSIVGPISEISALIKGIRSGLSFLLSRRQTSGVREAAPDEPMFI